MRILVLNYTSRPLIVSELTETVLICYPVIFIVIISRTFIWKAQLAISKGDCLTQFRSCLIQRRLSLSLDENVRAKEGGKEKNFYIHGSTNWSNRKMLPEAGLEGCSFLRGNIDHDNRSRRINAVIHLLFSVFLVQYLHSSITLQMTFVSTGVAVHTRLVRQTYKQGLSALVMTLPSSGFSKPGATIGR